MCDDEVVNLNRRSFFKLATSAVAVSALPKYSFCFNSADDRIKVAIVGCGRSGRKAALGMFKADKNISIISLSDVFEDCAKALHSELSERFASISPSDKKVFNVPQSRIFTGLDCYKEAIATDCDVVVFATPPVFRPREFSAAIDASKHAFLEKPVCVDPVQARQMWVLADRAKAKGLSAICGLQRRYHAGYREAVERVRDGQIGRLMFAQCFWFLPHFDGMELKTTPDADPEELEYQLRNWALFTWACGDHIVEQQVHNLDIARWILGRDPISVAGLGGRGTSLPMPKYGNRFSHFAVDYDYGNGVHLEAKCRQECGTAHYVVERFVGTEGVLETNLFARHKIRGKVNWDAPESPDPVVQEHRELLLSIRNSKPINTITESTDSAMLGVAGRLSAYSGKKFKYNWAKLRSRESLMPKNLKFGKLPIAPLAVAGEYKLI